MQAQSTSSGGLELFRAMMPAFSSERCVNCHGAVDPMTGDNHGGGVVDNVEVDSVGDMTSDNQVCLTCHTAGVTQEVVPADPAFGRDEPSTVLQGLWRLAPKKFSFVDKDDVALCNQLRTFALGFGDDVRADEFAKHMGRDPLIRLAFIGKRGDAVNTADPPPISDAQLVAGANRWFGAGMRCDGTGSWSGTLQRLDTDYQVDDPVKTSGTQAGLPISSELTQERHGTWKQTWEILPVAPRSLNPTGRALVLRARWTGEYSGSDSFGSKGVGVASCPNHQLLSIERTTTRQVTRSASASGEVDVQLNLARDGIFALSASPPSDPGKQTVTSVERSSASGGCGPEAPKETTQTSTIAMAWQPGNVRAASDPDNPNDLSGSDTLNVPTPAGARFKLDKSTTTSWSLHRK